MATDELHWLGIAEAGRLLRKGDLSPVEIAEDTLSWIDRTAGVTRSYVTLTAERALEEARAAEKSFQSGEDRGPMQGITYSVKDVIAVGGAPMKCNADLTKDFVPTEDSNVVKRLTAGGGVCLGKVQTHGFSWGVTSPPTRNPWDGQGATGGSSGGSGASVAAGQCQGSAGADCGCSVRNPAALNGVCGMRVTAGRVGTSGSVPLSMTMDTIGPLARSVEDTALMLGVMAGWDPADPTSSTAPVPDFAAKIGQSVEGLVAGVPTNFFFDHIETGVKRRVEEAIETLKSLGMEIREIELPHAHYSGGAFTSFVVAESAALLDEYVHWRADELGIDVRAFVELGNLLLAKDYCRGQQIRAIIGEDFGRAFEQVDVIITPTVAATSKPSADHPIMINVEYPDGYEEDILWAYCRYTVPVSMAGCPAMIVPCGPSDDGLPTSIQIVAPAFDEQTAFQVGHAYEQATEWHTQRPTHLMEAAGASA